MPDFTNDWFDVNIENWTKWLAHLKGQEGARILEIGSFEGRSALWLIENILTGANATMTCIDPWQDSYEKYLTQVGMRDVEERFRSNLAEHLKSGKAMIHKRPSYEILPEMIAERVPPYDMGYVDGNHYAHFALRDIVEIFELIKPGGLLIVDDYKWHDPQHFLNPGVAIHSFISSYQPVIQVIELDKQLCCRKEGTYTVRNWRTNEAPPL